MSGTEFEVVALGPGDVRPVLVRAPQAKLGKVVMLRAADAPDAKLTLKLEPMASVTGQLRSGEGKPLGGLWVQAETPRPQSRQLPAVQTDAQGRFQFNVLPGCEYSIDARATPMGEYFGLIANHVKAEPGAKIELGEVTVKRPKQ